MMGKPIDSASGIASSTVGTMPSEPGTVGTPTSIIVARAVALSPIERICAGVGPMNVMSDRAQISLNSAFSARNP